MLARSLTLGGGSDQGPGRHAGGYDTESPIEGSFPRAPGVGTREEFHSMMHKKD